MLKDEICNLAANVQQGSLSEEITCGQILAELAVITTLPRTPSKLLLVANQPGSAGEPAIDDGGPKREFFSGGQVQFLGIDLGLIFILLFVSSVRGVIFWMIISV